MKKQKFKTKNWYMLNSLKILASWVKYALNLLFFNQYRALTSRDHNTFLLFLFLGCYNKQ